MLSKFLSSSPKVNENRDTTIRAEYPPSYGYTTRSGERVNVAGALGIATAYRAKNIISDDVAKMPFQVVRRNGRNIEQVKPDAAARNLAYLLQVSPNEWGWTPFQFKKSVIEWQLFYGNAFIWKPAVNPAQLLILPADKTLPVFDVSGNLWYRHTFTNGKTEYIPSVEILHLLINPDVTGFMGRGIITFARETFGRMIAAHKTQANMYANGFMPAAYVKMAGELDSEKRKRIRAAYEESMSGSENAYRLAVFDNKITEFQPIEINAKDQEFIASMDFSEREICNFFGVPEHMLNRGKEAYNSNEQKYIEYLQGTLDAYLVPWEEAARIKWLSSAEQPDTYCKFVREALLRMDSKTRAETLAINIQNGLMSPNEGREKQDMSAYELGDQFFMASNIAAIKDQPDPAPDPAPTMPDPAHEAQPVDPQEDQGETNVPQTQEQPA